jgi:hypothetical protein
MNGTRMLDPDPWPRTKSELHRSVRSRIADTSPLPGPALNVMSMEVVAMSQHCTVVGGTLIGLHRAHLDIALDIALD